jgi:hypothetical protein
MGSYSAWGFQDHPNGFGSGTYTIHLPSPEGVNALAFLSQLSETPTPGTLASAFTAILEVNGVEVAPGSSNPPPVWAASNVTSVTFYLFAVNCSTDAGFLVIF